MSVYSRFQKKLTSGTNDSLASVHWAERWPCLSEKNQNQKPNRLTPVEPSSELHQSEHAENVHFTTPQLHSDKLQQSGGVGRSAPARLISGGADTSDLFEFLKLDSPKNRGVKATRPIN